MTALDPAMQRADPTPRRVLQRFVTPLDGHRSDARSLYAYGLMFEVGRHGCLVPEHQSVSFGSYFNAFPAAYWRRWADLDWVRLRSGCAAAAR